MNDPVSALLTGISASDGSSLTFARDGLLPTSETWAGPVAGLVGFQYDSDFRVVAQLVNAANAVPFAYYKDNLPTTAGNMSLTWHPQTGLLTSTALGGVTDTRSYNGFGELSNYMAMFTTTPLYSYALSRDALGRIATKSETIGGQTVNYAYAYDDAGRLHEVRTNGVLTAAYAYDLNGNRLQRISGPQSTTSTYDDRDRLRQRTAAAQVTDYDWSPNGDLLRQTVAGASTTYTYDARGNFRGVALPNGTQIEYLVDGASRRIGKKINDALANGWLYQDELNPIAELDGSNTVVSRFIYGSGINAPDSFIRGGVTYRILCDHLGSPRLVVNTARPYLQPAHLLFHHDTHPLRSFHRGHG